MNDNVNVLAPPSAKPALPIPARERWQPLRMGLVELFRYDSEEFWFRDGHLLLRGNNGTGKSKVLSLTLPFLLDAQIKSSRIEPDGDSGKKMAWNLLMNSYERRVGYAWIEFGRLANDGTPHYLSLGAGLSAAVARNQVDAWFFLIEDGARINQDLWLTSPQRVVFTKERLREHLQGQGQVFDTARDYRRAVDERLFHLGPKRYDGLMDTLIQLRQPQLSKKPDETALSNALTEALPPLAPELLGDVADALGQLEEDRRQLDEFQALAKAVERFEQRYRTYAGTQSRRQARVLRQAQTEFDNASRTRNEVQTQLESARAEEASAHVRHNEADTTLRRARARLEVLRADPRMQDANALDRADKDAAARHATMEHAATTRGEAQRRLTHTLEDTERAEVRTTHAERRLSQLRQESANQAAAAGVMAAHGDTPLVTLDAAALVELTQRDFDDAGETLNAIVRRRRDEIAFLRRRREDVERVEWEHAEACRFRDERQFEVDGAREHRTRADAEVERQGKALVDGWERFFTRLEQLPPTPEESAAALAALAEWVVAMRDENPAHRLLQATQQRAAERLAKRGAVLADQCLTLEKEMHMLEGERSRLEAGIDVAPPPPYTRGPDVRTTRAGAPLWHLVDFRMAVSPAQRAGLEAALEASGLLDAWVSPDGHLQRGDGGALLHDTQVLTRGSLPSSLADWLEPAAPTDSAVPATVVARVLAGISCPIDAVEDAEAWISPDGRFRLGALAGAWEKATADHIGRTARESARSRRLAEITERLVQLAHERTTVQVMTDQLARDRTRADEEWGSTPTDDMLRSAHIAAAAAAQAAQVARQRFTTAQDRHSAAEQNLKVVREQFYADAVDMHLPDTPEALFDVETALDHYRDTLARLMQAGLEFRLAVPELLRCRTRTDEARADIRNCEERLEAARRDWEDASARFEALQDSVGTKVDDLKRQLANASKTANLCDDALKQAALDLRDMEVKRAVTEEKAATAGDILKQRGEARAQAIVRWQSFVNTGLLASAIPDIELPDMSVPWTIDPALTLARRSEQILSELKDDDDVWSRVQKQINEEYSELQRALSALGHQVVADVGDWGLVVQIIYQNRPERPDRLYHRLADEIFQRTELLTAKEREILENHLQAEIATEIQRLLQSAEQQRDMINKELYKRPTSTGVRFRLVWQALNEDEGAPVGLEAARKRLLNTDADLWSPEDRGVVGAMLQQCIRAERERASSFGGTGGSLLEQLTSALDYRHWHRFRVERYQDGYWRKLSGPASSGERALGLTVPLFAAVASFYRQGSHPLVPRLILLDEAFAGIDDAARAHCMGLIREFDLDFVLTSEREWACYADLPGVAICQLQRREGIDAVFVSRWIWDGRTRTREADPDRRFAPQ